MSGAENYCLMICRDDLEIYGDMWDGEYVNGYMQQAALLEKKYRLEMGTDIYSNIKGIPLSWKFVFIFSP